MKIDITRALAAVTMTSLTLAGCGGGGGSATPGVLPQSPQAPNLTYTGPSTLADFAWGKQLVQQLPYKGPVQVATMSVVVQVAMQNAQGLLQYAQEANDPSSPLYRRWLTPQEIADRFGASPADYQKVASYFASLGMNVGLWPQREAITVTGTEQQFEQAFGTSFGLYAFAGKTVIAPVSAPHFSTALPVTAVVGLVNGPLLTRYIIKGTNAQFFGYSPQQLATGFDYSSAWGAGFTGAGINAGIIGTGPILYANGQDEDVPALGQFWHANVAPITQVAAQAQPASAANGNTGTGAVDPYPGGLAPPPPVTYPCQMATFPNPNNYNTCNPEDGEAQLDTESIASLAPGANVLFYLAYNPSDCVNPTTGAISAPVNGACPTGTTAYPQEGIQLTDDEIQQAIADDRADILSLSFGLPENVAQFVGLIQGPVTNNQPGIEQIEFASLAAEGIATFVSSGDDGAWECFDPVTGNPLGTPCVSYPASDPNVTAVGGVNIPLDESGNLTGTITAWADNTTQGGDGSFSNNVGSGGGISQAFSAPPWQAAVIGATQREVPDISLDADPNTGPSVIEYGGTPFAATFASGGTSAAAPEAAAEWALVLQACKASSTCNKGGTTGYRLGNPAPLFYAIYAKNNSLAAGPYAPSGFTPQLGYSQVFYDVVVGGNQAMPPPGGGNPAGYTAGPGYDMVTGLGVPFAGHLIDAIVGGNLP